MTRQLSENVLKTDRHETFYLACGPEDGPLVIFCHGWPELSITWRQQLEALGATGVRAIAPDMRGYGRSTVHPNKEDYRIEDIVNDMVELLDHLGAEKAVWVGHDLGAPVMWSIAQQFPERCHGMIGICVPYLPNALTLGSLVATVDRELYPVEQFPNGQWDYIAFYQDHFDLATKAFDADPKNTVHALFRAGEPSMMTMPSLTATTSARGGWFGPNATDSKWV
ncbi:MAG: alpha/beta hydrolase [Pseudomonadota bacterium]